MSVLYKFHAAFRKTEYFCCTILQISFQIQIDGAIQGIAYVLQCRGGDILRIIRKQGRLVRVHTECIQIRIAGCLNLSKSGIACHIVSYVHAALVLSQRNILTLGGVYKVSYPAYDNLHLRIHIPGALLVSFQEIVDHRIVHAAQEADLLRGRIDSFDGLIGCHHGCRCTDQIGHLILLVQNVVDVGWISVAFEIKLLIKEHKFLIRILLCRFGQRICHLPGSHDDDIVFTGIAVIQKSRFPFGLVRCRSAHLLYLEIKHVGAQFVPESGQTFIGRIVE